MTTIEHCHNCRTDTYITGVAAHVPPVAAIKMQSTLPGHVLPAGAYR